MYSTNVTFKSRISYIVYTLFLHVMFDRFRPEDAFVGYHKDIPATVLYQAFELARQQSIQEESSSLDTESDEKRSKCKDHVSAL